MNNMSSSPYLRADGTVKTFLDDESKSVYPCHGGKECKHSWTYDDWHCTGCPWKGMGRADLENGDDELRATAKRLWIKLNPVKHAHELIEKIDRVLNGGEK